MTPDNRSGLQETIDTLAELVRKLEPGTDAYNQNSFAILRMKCRLGQIGVSVPRGHAAIWWNSIYPDQEPIRSKNDTRLSSACNEYLADTLSDWKIFDQRYVASRVTLFDRYASQVICYPHPWQPVFSLSTDNSS